MRPPLLVLAVVLGSGPLSTSAAQGLPQGPVSWLGGRMIVSGSVSAATASGGTDTSFNAGDYGQDTLRLVELTVAPTVALTPAAFLAADLRAAGGLGRSDWYFRPYTLVAGLRPVRGRPVTVSAGLLQTPFGGAARGYGRENLLVGLPLVYQYRSVLPASGLHDPTSGAPPRGPAPYADRTGQAAGSPYAPVPPAPSASPVTAFSSASPDYGSDYDATGLPIVDTRGWNAGVRLDAGGDRGGITAALTRGALSNPLSRSGSPGWQVAGRVAAQPTPGLVVGLSGVGGRYGRAPSRGAALNETVLGADVEWSRDYWLVRGEVVHSRRDAWWDDGRHALQVTGLDIEARYRLLPGLSAAARAGRLWFGQSPSGAAWDADVSRLEAGFGWSPSRPALVKVSYQYNRRPDGPGRHTLHRAAVQALVWF